MSLGRRTAIVVALGRTAGVLALGAALSGCGDGAIPSRPLTGRGR